MHTYLKPAVGLAMAALLAVGIATAASATTAASNTDRHVVASPPIVAPTCATVPVSVVVSDVGESMVATGTNPFDQQVLQGFGGGQLLVGGKPMTVVWIDCSFAHNPANLSELNLDVSYLVEPTAAQAVTIFQTLCASLRTIASNYSTPTIGDGACVQGHSGGMQSSNGFVTVDNVVVQLMGSMSPSQAIALEKSIAPLVAAAKATANGSAPGGVTPVVRVVANQYVAANGVVPLRLRCSRARCSGVAQLKSGSLVLAQRRYVLPKGKTATLALALTARGKTAFSTAVVTPVRVTLRITVSGGKSIVTMILVS